MILLKKLKNKKITTVFSIISFIAGFLFLDKTITGNAIINNPQTFELLPLIGIGLFLCSILLAYYSTRNTL